MQTPFEFELADHKYQYKTPKPSEAYARLMPLLEGLGGQDTDKALAGLLRSSPELIQWFVANTKVYHDSGNGQVLMPLAPLEAQYLTPLTYVQLGLKIAQHVYSDFLELLSSGGLESLMGSLPGVPSTGLSGE